MTIQTSTLRPGLLVSLKTSIHGNVKYAKTILEADRQIEETGTKVARWETERTIALPEEHEAARKARSKASQLITSVCARSAFGLLCPEVAAESLEKAIKRAREIADEFNETAVLSRISIYVITGRIASDDVEAVKAISSEVRDLMDDMERGVKNLDVKGIREAASRVKEIGTMLSPETQARVTLAVEAARGAAKKIVQAGEQAAAEVDLLAVARIQEARTAFLDLDEQKEVQAPAAQQRALDLEPSAPIAAPASVAPALEV